MSKTSTIVYYASDVNTIAAGVEVGLSSEEAEDDLQHFWHATLALLRHTEENSVKFFHLMRVG